MKALGLLYIVSLGLIALGCALIYLPAAPLAVGLIVWFDLNRKDAKP